MTTHADHYIDEITREDAIYTAMDYLGSLISDRCPDDNWVDEDGELTDEAGWRAADAAGRAAAREVYESAYDRAGEITDDDHERAYSAYTDHLY